MACSAAFSTRQSGWSSPASIVTVATVFAVGALPAWPVAAVATALLASGREPAARFACAFLTLAAVTVAATAALYALWYRDYYADWHAAALSVEWMFQFAFTTAGAVFQFLVLGLRMYLPLGLVALFVAAMHLSRHAR